MATEALIPPLSHRECTLVVLEVVRGRKVGTLYVLLTLPVSAAPLGTALGLLCATLMCLVYYRIKSKLLCKTDTLRYKCVFHLERQGGSDASGPIRCLSLQGPAPAAPALCPQLMQGT